MKTPTKDSACIPGDAQLRTHKSCRNPGTQRGEITLRRHMHIAGISKHAMGTSKNSWELTNGCAIPATQKTPFRITDNTMPGSQKELRGQRTNVAETHENPLAKNAAETPKSKHAAVSRTRCEDSWEHSGGTLNILQTLF